MITSSTIEFGIIPVIAGGKKPAYFNNKANRFGKTITISGSGASAGFVNFFNSPIFASDCSTITEYKSYSIEFIYFNLLYNQDIIYSCQTGGAQPHIHPKDLYPISIICPPLSTQTQIATILTDMDDEIQALESKLSKYRLIKQGMMQELLTGRIRLV
jgi:type I restriction enzyme, S subunit